MVTGAEKSVLGISYQLVSGRMTSYHPYVDAGLLSSEGQSSFVDDFKNRQNLQLLLILRVADVLTEIQFS